MTTQRFQAPTGMHDILPAQQPAWEHLRKLFSTIAFFYGFRRIDTPMVEHQDVFARGAGEGSDIVQKQMYTLKGSGGDIYALRPEATPSIVRAYLEHGMFNLSSPLKLYYMGPMFRRERPQAGRFRQFHQFGVETLGENDPVLDVQIIQMFCALFTELRMGDMIVHINSIGCLSCRPRYKKVLKDYYRGKIRQVCADCRKRYKENILRMLDCKEEKCQRNTAQAPPILDYLCEECHNHFKKVLELMDASKLPYFVNAHLVRGLDYYTKTVFEIFPGTGASSPQQVSAIAAGGRYDGLVKLLGGRDTPAVGGAIGVERLLLALEGNKRVFERGLRPRVFLIQLGDLAKKKSLELMEIFRKAGIPMLESLGRASIKSQLRMADRHQVQFALILGQQEAIEDTIIVREMQSGIQETIPMGKLIPYLKKRMKKK